MYFLNLYILVCIFNDIYDIVPGYSRYRCMHTYINKIKLDLKDTHCLKKKKDFYSTQLVSYIWFNSKTFHYEISDSRRCHHSHKICTRTSFILILFIIHNYWLIFISMTNSRITSTSMQLFHQHLFIKTKVPKKKKKKRKAMEIFINSRYY